MSQMHIGSFVNIPFLQTSSVRTNTSKTYFRNEDVSAERRLYVLPPSFQVSAETGVTCVTSFCYLD